MSGLTVEVVNAMQDEMNRIDGIDDDTSATDEAAKLAAEEAAKSEETKAAEEAAKLKAEEEAKNAEAAKSKVKSEDESVDETRELREQIRASNEALRKITDDYQKLQKIMIDKGIISEDDVKATKEAEEREAAIVAERQTKLTEMVTIMELNPSYSDVRQVCTRANLDDLVDGFARYYVKENGGDLADVSAKMESEIWAEPNPYKKIYELVKKYHPKYATPAETEEQKKEREAKEVAEKIAKEADEKSKKKPVEPNPSAADIGPGGGGTGGGGWTAAKIDSLPEEELTTVPKDIYDKYLKGLLA